MFIYGISSIDDEKVRQKNYFRLWKLRYFVRINVMIYILNGTNSFCNQYLNDGILYLKLEFVNSAFGIKEFLGKKALILSLNGIFFFENLF